jgi:hypothetical protein
MSTDLSNYNFYNDSGLEDDCDESHYINGNRSSKTDFLAPMHDLYCFLFPDWVTVGDCSYGGERVIKLKGERYLIKTSGQKESQDKIGTYKSYKSRATFFGYPAKVLKTMVGLMSRKDDFFELPKNMEYLREKATFQGDSIQELGRKTKECVSAYGRSGILAYVSRDENQILFKKYNAFDIRDWIVIDGEVRAILLDESDYRPTKGFSQEIDPRFLLIGLNKQGIYYQVIIKDEQSIPKLDQFDYDNPKKEFSDSYSEPEFKGSKSKIIPWQFFNPSDNSHIPGVSPILNLCNMTLALYRNEADYRQQLFIQSQGTPVFTGFDKDETNEILLGCEGGIASENSEAQASFLELKGNGLPEARNANLDLHKHCVQEGLSLVVTTSEPESNAALMTRMDSKTASIAEIVEAYENGFLDLLRTIAIWMKEDPDSIRMIANKDFMRSENIGQEIMNITEGWLKGYPVSVEDLHKHAIKNDLTESSLEDILSSNAKFGIKPLGAFGMLNMTNDNSSSNKEGDNHE